MLKRYFGFAPPVKQGKITKTFFVLFALLVVIAAVVWVFYRSLFNTDSSILGVVFLAGICGWFWAYLIGFSRENAE